MTASEFVEKLAALAPGPEAFSNKRLSEGYIRQFIESFGATGKHESQDCGNELLNLIKNYNVSSIEIGSIHFDLDTDAPYGIPPADSFLRIGYMEADLLVIDRVTGKIGIEDHEVGGRLMSYCAKNAETFLDALYETAKATSKSFSSPPNGRLVRGSRELQQLSWRSRIFTIL